MSGALEMGHARALLALPAAQQGGAAARVVSETLSVRDTERLVGTLINPAQRATRRAASARDPDTVRLENEVAEKLGAAVRIEAGSKGAGRLVINYNSLEELDGILARFDEDSRACVDVRRSVARRSKLQPAAAVRLASHGLKPHAQLRRATRAASASSPRRTPRTCRALRR